MPTRIVTRADAAFTYTLAGLALWLSYTALVDLAARSGFGGPQAAVWPLVVDGLIFAATRAVVTFGDHPARRYAWCLLAASAVASVAANAAHVLLPAGPVPPAVAAAVAITPPVGALAVTHLAVVRSRVRAASKERAIATRDTPVTHNDAIVATLTPAAAPGLDAAATRPASQPATDRDVDSIDPLGDAGDAPDAAVSEQVDGMTRRGDAARAPGDAGASHGAPLDRASRRLRARELSAAGLSNYEIGAELGVSEGTIRRDLLAVATV